MNKNHKIIAFILLFQICVGMILNPISAKADVASNSMSGTINVSMHKTRDKMQPYIDAFTKKYPNVKVEYKCLTDYDAQINQLLAEDNAPDVFLVPSSLPYDDYDKVLSSFGSMIQLADKYKYIEKGITKNGHVYGLPSYISVYGLIYNKKIFDQAGITSLPTTIEEFKYDCNLISQHTEAVPFYTNYKDSWAVEYWDFFPFIEMSGKADYKFNEYIYDKEPFSKGSNHYEVYKLLFDLIEAGYTEPIGEGNFDKGIKELAYGKAASMVMGSWAYREIQNIATNPQDIGFMPFPNNVNGEQYVSVKTDYSYGVSAKSENLDAAKAFVSFMIDESGYAVDTGNISILKTDPYADYLNELNQVTMVMEGNASDSDYWLLDSLQKNIRPGSGEEIKRIMDAAAGIRDESFETIMDDWNIKWEKGRPEFYEKKQELSEAGEVITKSDDIYISDQEAEYIESNPKLRMGYIRNFAPFSYEIDGNPTGLVFDVCNEIKNNLGFEIDYFAYETPREAVDALGKGEIDVIAGLINTKIDNVTFSKSFYDVLNVYVCTGDTDISSIYSHKGIISPLELDSKFSYVEESEEGDCIMHCLEALDKEQADYTIANYYTADYYIKDLEYAGLSIIPSSVYSSIGMAFRKDVNGSLIALINKCMYAISKESLQVKLLSYSTPPKKPLTFKRLVKNYPTFLISITILISLIIIVAGTIVLIYRGHTNRSLSFEMEKYNLLGDMANELMFDYDYRKKSYNFDSKFQKFFGFSTVLKETETVEQKYLGFIEKIEKIQEDIEEQDVAFQMTTTDGVTNWYKMFLSTINDKYNNPVYTVGKLVDVQKEVEEMLTFQDEAERDGLTKILNRRGFRSKLPEYASNVLYAVLDMDNFKNVNDTLGHAGGDMVLCLLAEKLTEAFGENAIVARYGGDEFVGMIPDITLEEAHERLAKLVAIMDRTVEYEGVSHAVSVSVGGWYSSEKVKVDEMFNKADEVLYEKKKAGKNGYDLKGQ